MKIGSVSGIAGRGDSSPIRPVPDAETLPCRIVTPMHFSFEAYTCKFSFFPQTIRDWNDLPDCLFSTAEMSDDCVSKFASLVHSRD